MSDEANKLISSLLEEENDFGDADLIKDISQEDPEQWLLDAGFTRVDGRSRWYKIMATQAITVGSDTIENVTDANKRLRGSESASYTISYYTKGENGWLYSNAYLANGLGMIDALKPFANIPVTESVEDDDFEDLRDIQSNDTYQELYQLIDAGILEIRGAVTRFSRMYVHENTTECSLEPYWGWTHSTTDEEQREQNATENRIDAVLDGLTKQINDDMRGWNHKIYRELEEAWEWSLSEEVAVESIIANDMRFDENGDSDDGGLTYEQLDDDAKKRAVQRWVDEEMRNQDGYWAEPVIDEWRWLLDMKGFGTIKIAYSGFGSQGDGASFTATSIDLKKYLTAPDPGEFPESERNQLSENIEDEDDDLKDVYQVNRKKITHIATTSDYEEFKARFADFFSREGITNLSTDTDAGEEFSWSPCDCCLRRLGGNRYQASGYNPTSLDVQKYEICVDCMYYAEYGQLDDQTMANLKDDSGEPVEESQEEEEDEDKDIIKDVIGEPQPAWFSVYSTHGRLIVRYPGGSVRSVERYDQRDHDADFLEHISMFNIEEYLKHSGKTRIEQGATLDILEIGYWLNNNVYEPPSEEWRDEIARTREQNQQP